MSILYRRPLTIKLVAFSSAHTVTMTTWRDVANQLTPTQVAELEHIERGGRSPEWLLMGARYYSALNCEYVTSWPESTPPPPGYDSQL
jgi:hypothetical protein